MEGAVSLLGLSFTHTQTTLLRKKKSPFEFWLSGCGWNLWCRIIGAVLIVVGLYFVLWGKTEERKFAKEQAAITSTPEHSGIRSASHAKTSLAQPLLLPSSTENVWWRDSWTIFWERKEKEKEENDTSYIHYYYFMSGSLCVYEGLLFSSFLLVNSHAFFLGLLEWGFSWESLQWWMSRKSSLKDWNPICFIC